jgi:D-alanyl-D-alanine carboxypeptidase/D-alanyl-D-alanine-endopeptidase (penicillin-binding protein 4)
VLNLLLFLVLAPSPEEQATRAIEEILRGPLRSGHTALYVADADTGERVFAVSPDEPMNPASNVKLISTATALELLGPDYRYRTRVLGETLGDDGVVRHDLYLLGSYDATLDRAGLDDLAAQLAAAGVTKIEGDVLVGTLPLRDGMFRSSVRVTVTATEPGDPPAVEVTPPSDLLVVVVTATTVRKRRPASELTVTAKTVEDATGRKRVVVSVGGEITRGRIIRRSVWIDQQALLAAHTLRSSLREHGVEVTGDARVERLADYVAASAAQGFLPLPLAEHRSLRLSQIVRRVNKRSINWLADRTIISAAALRHHATPTMQSGVEAMYRWLARHTGFDRDDLVIDSGSGLSYRTELSARQVVAVLRAALANEAFVESLAVGGEDGTLRHRFEDLDGVLRGKTGTLTRVVSLAGVLEVPSGRRLVFAIITNGHRRGLRKRVRRAHERIVETLCGYLARTR